MELDSMMPRRMHPTLKKPCCNGKKKAAPWAEGTLNTEYRNQFQDKEVPYIRAGPRPDGPRDNGAFDDSTTYGDGFKHYQVPRAEPCKPLNSQSVEGLPFAGESTYRQGFGPKAVPYQKAGPPAAEAKQSGPFDGSTTYGNAFPLRQVPAPPAPVTRATNIESGGPFVGESLYKATFTNMGNAARAPKKPAQGGQVFPQGAFDDGTMYRSMFVPKTSSVPQQFRPADSRPLDGGRFQGSTEARDQFQMKEIPRVDAARPVGASGVLPTGSFQDGTTYGDGFQRFQVPRAEPCKPLNSQSVEGLPFAGESTYRQGFGPKAVPYQKAGPPVAEAKQSGPFDGSTTYGRAFPLRQVPAPPAPVTRATNIESGGPFVGESLYKATFTNMGNAKRHAKRPGQERVETGPFCGDTTYRNTYVPKQAAPREPDCVPCCSDCDDDE